MKGKNKGFSLIELMIVIAIIGILASIAVPSYQTYVKKSKVAKLLAYIQAGQAIVAEHVATTGDNTCLNLAEPTTTPEGLYGYYYGNFEGSCYTEADGFASDFGNTFYLRYNGVVQSDGSITWECYYYIDPNGDVVDFAPQGCVNAV